MILVSETTGSNEIKFIPREGYRLNAVLTDETTGEEVTEYLDFTSDGYYSVCTLTTDLINQRRYNLKVYSSLILEAYSERVIADGGVYINCVGINEDISSFGNVELIYNDIVFCSTQDNEDYSIDNGELDYSSAPTTTEANKREFIII